MEKRVYTCTQGSAWSNNLRPSLSLSKHWGSLGRTLTLSMGPSVAEDMPGERENIQLETDAFYQSI